MPYDFEARHSRLAARMRAVNSRSITISRESEEITVRATAYEIPPEELIAYGLPLDVRRIDYIVSMADLVETVFANPLNPIRLHDKIQDGDLTLKVTPLGDRPCFKWTSHNRIALRIHAVVIATPQIIN
jgi:hypothetical protein